ncbi:inactivation-no-after-potential D protein [Bactrocera neohumeralis]|uniref:inactivation-no-after-potential D protein n=1 Tax=Bactrocera tryoni TaxID=59916 RepID=UPI001A965B8C|nr:inactivation-no-after-potential D protein [Bactrocera tryoni]XP_050325529.1 inactivation-no-after-potential D protein [Bactrocera neohumeralis]
MVQINSGSGDHIHTVTLDKTGKKSFGICIVRGEVKDSPNSKTSGIFIKGIVPDSPAHLCGKLKVGDRILSLNNKDVRNATEQAVIELIKDAGIKINLEIQTYGKDEKKTSERDQRNENGYVQAKAKFAPEPPMSANKSSAPKETPRNPAFSASIRQKPASNFTANDEDDEDTRDMTGRIRTESGYEIDRASAGNCKLNKQEKERDKEQPDEFGYTMAKIKKRYNLMKDLRKIEVTRAPNTSLGLALAGHKDRRKMACFVAGINSNGLLASLDIKPGDEILEVNGNVLQNRCHLNASVIFKNIDTEKIILITSRRKDNDEGISVKPIKKFPKEVDDTKFLFDLYPNARSVQVKKEGFLGIMVIYGKHVEVGNGIFISDLREESNAVAAGVKVGDMLLAVNKDVTLESNYDEAVALIRRAEGIVTLVLLTLKSEEALKAEKEAAEKKKEEAKIEAEKPQDPSVAEIKVNKKILIELKVEKKPLGVIVVGGKNNHVKTGCIITHIYPDGAIAADKRLNIFDHIVEVNSKPVNCSEMTTLKVHQIFHTTYEKVVTFQVFRADPLEVEKFNVEFIKKPGKDLGLSLAPNDRGCTISEIIPSGYAEIDNKLQRGDIITKFNGDSLEGCTFEICYALFKGANGKISLEITRPKPTCRTEASK